MKATISARDFDQIKVFLKSHPEIPRTFGVDRFYAVEVVEVELPDRTEDFLRLVEPLGRFQADLCSDGFYIEFHNDYD